MSRIFKQMPSRGFSLIEVLIAVVILSLGLLALASLQLSLIRSSADTKAQSIGLSLAKQRLEVLRGYQSTGGGDNACTSPVSGGSNTCYRAITDETSTVVDGDASVTGNQPIGGVTFSRAVNVQRYVYNKAVGVQAFVLQTASDVALDSTLLTSPTTYLTGKEFKRIAVTVSWTDPTGASRSLVVEDALAAFNPADSAAVSKSSKGATPRTAKAIITNPASVAGVIPIAIGSGSDTAATNPRPVIVSQGNSSTVVETRFDIYTYAALSGTAAQAQSRVETSVVGCRCSRTAQTQVANRPTYWDGFKYTNPTTASGIPVSAQATGNGLVQSTLCDSCCRDHHDPSGVVGAKFDPRRSTHDHFLNTALTSAVTAGTYDDACRLIRVDGVFRVAPDSYNDDLMMLSTAGMTLTSPTTTVVQAVPASGSGSTSTQYQDFVIDYMKARFAQTTKSVYNTPVDPTIRTNYATLQLPAVVGINSTNAPKYMHARGLYIDYLEPEVQDIVKDAYDTCLISGKPAECVLKYLPFTSVNITELAVWASSLDTKVGVSNNGFPDTIDDPLPVRGKATLKNAAAVGDTATGSATMQRSAAGLAVANPVFPVADIYNANVPTTDGQGFLVGTVNYGSTNGQFFTVNLTGTAVLQTLTLASPADVRTTISTQATCNAFPATQFASYKCIPNSGESLPASATLAVGNYNRELSVAVGNPCSSSAAAMTYKKVFDVASADMAGNSPSLTVTLNNSTGNIAAGGEYTTLGLTSPQVLDQAVVTVNFSAPAYLCPSNWSTYINTNGTAVTIPSGNAGNTWKQANCSGNGNKDPNFGSTYTSSCPTGFSPFNGN